MNKLFRVLFLVVLCSLALAQSNKQTTWRRTVQMPLASIPTSATALWTSDTDVLQVILTNTNATTQVTVTVQDGNGNVFVQALINGVTAQNNHFTAVYPSGLYATGGVTWTASAAGVNGSIVGRQ